MSAFVFDAVRTPRGAGSDKGSLREKRPDELVALLVRALAARGVPVDRTDDMVLGCVTQIGEQGGNIAKTAALVADLPDHVGASTINRYCASSLDAVGTAASRIAAGGADVMLAGGVESMSRVPMLSDNASHFGLPAVVAKTKFVHMGLVADALATLRGFSREALDDVAVLSHERAARAQEEQRFARSLVPVEGAVSGTLARDELVRAVTKEKLARFPAAFGSFGAAGGDDLLIRELPELERVSHLHTIATSPGIADGASLVGLASARGLERLGLRPRARIRSVGYVSVSPVRLLEGASRAALRALELAGIAAKEVDRFECNESFAVTVLDFIRTLDVDPTRVNPDGGAIALGHPLGATGGILLATLLDGLERSGGTLGLATIPGGGGVAVSVLIERV